MRKVLGAERAKEEGRALRVLLQTPPPQVSMASHRGSLAESEMYSTSTEDMRDIVITC